MGQGLTLPFLEYIAHQMGCTYLSDLRFLDDRKSMQLTELLQKIPFQAVSLQKWNNTLDYLVYAPPELTAETVRD